MTKYTAIITIKTANNTTATANLPCYYFTFGGAVRNARRMGNLMIATSKYYRGGKIDAIDVYAINKGEKTLAGFTLC